MIGSSVDKAVLHINPDRCRLCRRCMAQKVCKVKAIVRIDREEAPYVDIHRCHGCRVCIVECPAQAINVVY